MRRARLDGPRSANPQPRVNSTERHSRSILHNIVHLAFGVAGLALARTFNGARSFLIGSGVIYLVLWLYGLVIDHQSAANFVPVNTADNWLHLGLGIGMLALGVLLGRTGDAPNRRNV